MKNKKAKMYIKKHAENNTSFSPKKLCAARWIVNAFKGTKKHSKEATYIIELCGIKGENKIKYIAESCSSDAMPLSRGMTFEVCIGLYKTLYHDPTSEFHIHNEKENPNHVVSINLEATKSTNPDIVVVPPPKNVILSLPTPSSSDKLEEESNRKPPAVGKPSADKTVLVESKKKPASEASTPEGMVVSTKPAPS